MLETATSTATEYVVSTTTAVAAASTPIATATEGWTYTRQEIIYSIAEGPWAALGLDLLERVEVLLEGDLIYGGACVASIPEYGLGSSGECPSEAIRNLFDVMGLSYRALVADERDDLGPALERQRDYLRRVMRLPDAE